MERPPGVTWGPFSPLEDLRDVRISADRQRAPGGAQKMVNMNLTPDQMASVVHEANRQFRLILGQAPGPHWSEADDNLKASTVNGVKAALEGVTPEELHEEWVAFKGSQGWTWGPSKDIPHRRHPCMVPYEQLPSHEKAKDHLFHSVIEVLKEMKS